MEYVSFLSFIACCCCLLLSPLLSFSSSSFFPHLCSPYPIFPFLIIPILPSILIYFPTSFFPFLLGLLSLPHLHFYNSSSSFLHTPVTSYFFICFLLLPSLPYLHPFLSFPFLPLSHFLFSLFLFLPHLSSPSSPSSISSNSFKLLLSFPSLLSPSLLSFPHRRQIRKQHVIACLFKTHVLLILV